MNNEIIQMNITLDNIEPAIWRRFIVDSSITLQALHEIIQVVMGWENSHLYSFHIGDSEYSAMDSEESDDCENCDPFDCSGTLDDDDFDDDFEDEVDEDYEDDDTCSNESVHTVKLQDLKLKPKQKFLYVYDFGDNWEHTITIEKISENTENFKTPQCLEGKRACPPEDCGSIPGYEDIIYALKNPDDEDSEDLLEWLGEDYDPERFEVEDVNEELREMEK